jgi:glycosyltransferase involved in cell wall biosynthesis
MTLPDHRNILDDGTRGGILVSCIIPFHREIEELAAAVQSVSAQRFIEHHEGCEIIVGNDSQYEDDELQSLLEALSVYPIAVVRNIEAKGAGNARNAALGLAQGNVIAFLDSDDRWHPDKLRYQLDMFYKGYTFVVSAFEYENSDKTIHPPVSISRPSDFYLVQGVGTSTVLLDKRLLINERFANARFCQDVHLWTRLGRLSEFNYSSVQVSLCTYSLHGRTSQATYFELAASFAHSMLSLGLPKRLVCYALLRYAYRGLSNRALADVRSLVSSLLARKPTFLFSYFFESYLFDLIHHTDTHMRIPKRALGHGQSSPSFCDGIHYVASFSSVIRSTLELARQSLGPRFELAQFVDLGCGKGKSLIIYSLKYGKRARHPCLGIEYDLTLCQTALGNFAKVGIASDRVQLIHGSATDLQKYVKSGLLLVYIYNSFTGETLMSTLESMSEYPHLLIYVDPCERNALSSFDYDILYEQHGSYHADTWLIAMNSKLRDLIAKPCVLSTTVASS